MSNVWLKVEKIFNKLMPVFYCSFFFNLFNLTCLYVSLCTEWEIFQFSDTTKFFWFFLLSSCSTYICGVKTTGNRVFICCIGSEANGLWTATMIWPSRRQKYTLLATIPQSSTLFFMIYFNSVLVFSVPPNR